MLSVVNPLLAQFGGENTGQFLGQNARNASAIETALKCGACVSSPFALKQSDLLVFDSNPATGSTMVGLIFVSSSAYVLKLCSHWATYVHWLTKTLPQLLTFTFSVFQILHINGDLLGAKLNLTSALAFRAIAALIAYLSISLWYTLINLAFGVPMTRRFGHGGFMVYWMLNFCTMGAREYRLFLEDAGTDRRSGPPDGVSVHPHWAEVGGVLLELL